MHAVLHFLAIFGVRVLTTTFAIGIVGCVFVILLSLVEDVKELRD